MASRRSNNGNMARALPLAILLSSLPDAENQRGGMSEEISTGLRASKSMVGAVAAADTTVSDVAVFFLGGASTVSNFGVEASLIDISLAAASPDGIG